MSDDPVLLITGATGGIGAATARAARAAGWRLGLGGRDEAALATLAEELGGAEHAVPIRCDVTEWEDQQAFAAGVADAFGRIDGVFANAGFGADAGLTASTPEHWRAMVLTNVLGVALTLRATAHHLRESRGHVLLTGSVAGRIHIAGSLYSATKHAVAALGEAARLELHGSGVRVTVLHPGYTQSPFWERELELEALSVDDIARTALWALAQPPHMAINEVVVRPTAQRP